MQYLRSLLGSNSSSSTAMTAVEASARLKDTTQPMLVIDVRQAGEFVEGHIQGARLMPLNTLGVKMAELPKDRDILVVCRSGARSAIATRQLTSAGFRAINMRGGMMAWEAAHLPVKRGK